MSSAAVLIHAALTSKNAVRHLIRSMNGTMLSSTFQPLRLLRSSAMGARHVARGARCVEPSVQLRCQSAQLLPARHAAIDGGERIARVVAERGRDLGVVIAQAGR